MRSKIMTFTRPRVIPTHQIISMMFNGTREEREPQEDCTYTLELILDDDHVITAYTDYDVLQQNAEMEEIAPFMMSLYTWTVFSPEVKYELHETLDAWGMLRKDLVPDNYAKIVDHHAEYYGHDEYTEPIDKLSTAEIMVSLIRGQLPVLSRIRGLANDPLLYEAHISGNMEHMLSAESSCKQPDLKSFCITHYGFYRKDLAKAVANSTLNVMQYMSWVAPYLTQDQVVRAFRSHAERGDLPPYIEFFLMVGKGFVQHVMEFLEHPTTRYALAIDRDRALIDNYAGSSIVMHYEDYEDLRHKKLAGWKDLLLHVSKRVMEKHADKHIEVPQAIEAISQRTWHGSAITVLHNSYDYYWTGRNMGNCVQSPDTFFKAVNHESYHVKFHDNNKPILLEIQNMSKKGNYLLNEVRGMDNESLDDESQQEVERFVSESLPDIIVWESTKNTNEAEVGA